MIRDPETWRRWEARWQRRTSADLEANLRVFRTLMEHARALGVWPPENPLEGIEVDLRLAKAVNTYVSKPTGTFASRP